MKFSETKLFNSMMYRWAHHIELTWYERLCFWLVRKGILR